MTAQETRAAKAALRAECKKQRESLSEDEKNAAEEKIAKRVINSQAFRYAKNVLIYSACRNEVSTELIFEACLEKGKRVYFPKTFSGGNMEFYCVCDKTELAKGRYGIYEPKDDTAKFEYNPSELSLCLVPALCFDRRGFRLGYGGGYYDRFIKSRPEIIYAGLEYDALFLDEIPFDKRYDKKADIVFTERGTYVFGQEEE